MPDSNEQGAKLNLERIILELKKQNESLLEVNRRLEAELRESEERFHLMADTAGRVKEEWESTFNSVPDLIAIIHNDYRVARVNRVMAERLGLQPEECAGVPCYELIHGMKEPPAFCSHAVTLATGSGQVAEIHEEHLGGDFLVTSTPLLDREGKMIGAVHVARDITDRRRAEEEIERLNTDLAARAAELEAVNRELEAFNYTVAHDLRKPLAVVNTYCQILQEMCSDRLDDDCRGYLDAAYDGTWRMNRLIDALLHFSRLIRTKPRREMVDLSAMARAVAAELEISEQERRVCFRITDGIIADGDPNLLRAVLDNLLGNAWKYTGNVEEAIIEFGVTEVEGKRAFFVRDNGAGFAMEEAGKLFIPFQRLRGAEEFTGFGIGLATVGRIIKRHGGKVWAEGEPGKGAAFYFTLG